MSCHQLNWLTTYCEANLPVIDRFCCWGFSWFPINWTIKRPLLQHQPFHTKGSNKQKGLLHSLAYLEALISFMANLFPFCVIFSQFRPFIHPIEEQDSNPWPSSRSPHCCQWWWCRGGELAYGDWGPEFDSRRRMKFVHNISVFMLIFCFSFCNTQLGHRAFLSSCLSCTTC